MEKIPAHHYAIYSIVMSPDGEYVATGSRDKTIKIWDRVNMKMPGKIDFKNAVINFQ